MELGLRGKVALVAASSQGLGRAIAHELATEGASLVMSARGLDRRETSSERSILSRAEEHLADLRRVSLKVEEVP